MLYKFYTFSYQFLPKHIDFKIAIFGLLDQKLGYFWLYNIDIQINQSLLTIQQLCYIINQSNKIKLLKTKRNSKTYPILDF